MSPQHHRAIKIVSVRVSPCATANSGRTNGGRAPAAGTPEIHRDSVPVAKAQITTISTLERQLLPPV
jgi:hypothetical protein